MSNPEYFGDDFLHDDHAGVPNDRVAMEADYATPRQPLPGNHQDNYYNCPPPPRPVLSRAMAVDRQSSQV